MKDQAGDDDESPRSQGTRGYNTAYLNWEALGERGAVRGESHASYATDAGFICILLSAIKQTRSAYSVINILRVYSRNYPILPVIVLHELSITSVLCFSKS